MRTAACLFLIAALAACSNENQSDVGLYVGKGQRTAHYLLAANGMDDPRGKVIALAKETVGRL